MGRKTYTALAIWFVLVVSCVVGAYVPLHYWSMYLRGFMPEGIELEQVSGHWWSGQADLGLRSISEPVQFSWSATSLFEPLNWHISHPEMVGYGQLQPSLHSLSVWVSGLSVKTEFLNPFLSPQNVLIAGQPIEVNRGFAVYDFSQNQFNAFRLLAHWPKGVIRYQEDNQSISANINDWRLQGFLEESYSDVALTSQPVISLLSEQGSPLFEMKLRPSRELELTVMPELIEAFGLRWFGKKAYPAFVLVQPIPKL